MNIAPKQLEHLRRLEREAAKHQTPRKRIRTIVIAIITGGIAWTGFYMTYGSHQITSLDEFESYLQGENLYQKYEVIHLNWDCRKLRSQFDERYISHSKSRIRRENETLIFIKPDLDGSDFNQWSQNALHHLSFGQVQKIDNKAKLVPAMMVRLFTSFRFRSGHLIKDVKNNFTNKCTS